MSLRACRVFNGIYTLQRGPIHWTFKIRTQPDDSRYYPGQRILAALTGPDNLSSYTPLGTVTDDGFKLFTRGLAKKAILDILWRGLIGEPTGEWELLEATTCVRCNRTLTTPLSIRTGIGPICAERYEALDPKIRTLLKKLFELEALQEAAKS